MVKAKPCQGKFFGCCVKKKTSTAFWCNSDKKTETSEACVKKTVLWKRLRFSKEHHIPGEKGRFLTDTIEIERFPLAWWNSKSGYYSLFVFLSAEEANDATVELKYSSGENILFEASEILPSEILDRNDGWKWWGFVKADHKLTISQPPVSTRNDMNVEHYNKRKADRRAKKRTGKRSSKRVKTISNIPKKSLTPYGKCFDDAEMSSTQQSIVGDQPNRSSVPLMNKCDVDLTEMSTSSTIEANRRQEMKKEQKLKTKIKDLEEQNKNLEIQVQALRKKPQQPFPDTVIDPKHTAINPKHTVLNTKPSTLCNRQVSSQHHTSQHCPRRQSQRCHTSQHHTKSTLADAEQLFPHHHITVTPLKKELNPKPQLFSAPQNDPYNSPGAVAIHHDQSSAAFFTNMSSPMSTSTSNTSSADIASITSSTPIYNDTEFENDLAGSIGKLPEMPRSDFELTLKRQLSDIPMYPPSEITQFNSFEFDFQEVGDSLPPSEVGGKSTKFDQFASANLCLSIEDVQYPFDHHTLNSNISDPHSSSFLQYPFCDDTNNYFSQKRSMLPADVMTDDQ